MPNALEYCIKINNFRTQSSRRFEWQLRIINSLQVNFHGIEKTHRPQPLVGLTRENPVLDHLAILHLDNRLYMVFRSWLLVVYKVGDQIFSRFSTLIMDTVDFSITSAIPIWLGDRAVECHVLLEPGIFMQTHLDLKQPFNPPPNPA